MHWRRKWQPTPVFLPGESQGRRSLVGFRLWDHTESDTTEVTQQQQQHGVLNHLSLGIFIPPLKGKFVTKTGDLLGIWAKTDTPCPVSLLRISTVAASDLLAHEHPSLR